MTNKTIWSAIGVIIVIAIAWYALAHYPTAPAANSTAAKLGLSEYTDTRYGFSFWYPNSWQVSATSTDDTMQFPGGTMVEEIQVGPAGGDTISVVESASSTITDEPNDHASPINQTKYFLDPSSGVWMIAYPEGSPVGDLSTSTAQVSTTTVSGLPEYIAGRRFDTNIIPLDSTLFLVVSDGGGSYAPPLAQTISANGMPINQASLIDALTAEATAYSNQGS